MIPSSNRIIPMRVTSVQLHPPSAILSLYSFIIFNFLLLQCIVSLICRLKNARKKYHAVLINRQELLEREISSRSVIHNVLITTKGLKYNEYSGFFDNVITLDELFD